MTGAAFAQWMRGAPLIALAAVLLPAPALLALHFRDGPPARVTGGFGEDSCVACHFGNAVNDAAGRLALTGFPERYAPGEKYDLELTLKREAAFAAAGFQLAIRLADGKTQAGTIEAGAGEETRIGLLDERGVRFAHHRVTQTAPPDIKAVRWKLSWTAPAERSGPIVLHAAALAADGDESQAGDFVYTLEVRSEQMGTFPN